MRPINEDDKRALPAALICAAMGTLALASQIWGSEPKAPKQVTVQRLAAAACGSRIPTHVTVAGQVESVRKEADGDYHLRLCASPTGAPCILVEIIPLLSADRIVEPKERAARSRAAVRKGDLVEVTGITRWDAGHRWWEIHPATRIMVLGRVPSGKGRR